VVKKGSLKTGDGEPPLLSGENRKHEKGKLGTMPKKLDTRNSGLHD